MKLLQTSPLDNDTLTQIWAEYVYEDKIDNRIRPIIAEDWKRCKSAGIDPIKGGYGKKVDEAIFQSILAENHALLESSRDIMQSVYDVLCQSRFTLTLTDSVGYVLECVGTKDAISADLSCNFTKGTLWSNLSVGTNAISVALDHDVSIQKIGAEHYCRSHHSAICSATSIHNPDGAIIGCLNLSSNNENSTTPHPHSLGLVIAAVHGIEGNLALHQTAEMMHAALEDGETSILFLSRDYHPIWANHSALELFQMEKEDLYQKDFRELSPNLKWTDQFWLHGRRNFFNDVRVLTKTAALRCSAVIYPLMDLGTSVLTVTLNKQNCLIESVNKLSGNRAFYTFDDVLTQDPNMKRVLSQAQKYARYSGNIFIEGESGTGKEILAQAIHDASDRATGPFVTVDCTSIQRGLWECGLFGYESGAFPGAAHEGNPGRFELANHGTLFFDQISELPLDIQNKLLRAIESHRITRIGGNEEIQLDIRIIAATNHNLENDVAMQSFSAELFYRLNVFRLDIPPLRDRRDDISYCVKIFIDHLNALYPLSPHSCSQEFLDGLMNYEWRGNIRELQNAIERAFLSSSEMILGKESLHAVFSTGIEENQAQTSSQDTNEANLIRTTLAICDGNVDDAAKKLGISRATLYRRLKKYNIYSKQRKYLH